MKNEEGEMSASREPSGQDTAQAVIAEPQLEALAKERDQLSAEKADLQDRLLRRMAEFDNFRRRAEREKAEIHEYSTMETLRRLLPVLDDFERAISTETADREYARGMELIFQRFAGELQKMGLEQIQAAGQPFNPHVHHALEMRQTSEVDDHTVLEELQKGYTFRGKLLRPAMVRVAVAPSAEETPEP
jgi:molecular chaperone GrpE